MAAITDLSDLLNRATGANNGTPENLWFYKGVRVAGVAATAPLTGRMHSLWTFDGFPSGGAVPTTAIIPDNTTDGALKQANPGGSRQKWLWQFGVTGLNGATYVLYDRLFEIGGLSGTTTTDQTVQGATPSPALTRYNTNSTCVGNQIMIEIHTAIGTTQTDITARYTNQAGTADQVTRATAIGGSAFRTQSRAFFLPLAAGDSGVQAVRDVKLAATTGTAGNFAVSIVRPLAMVGHFSSGGAGVRDFTVGLPGIPEILTNASLGLLYFPSSTTTQELYGSASFIEA